MEFFLFGIGKNLFNVFFSIKKYDKGISFLSVNISVDEVRIDNNIHKLINERTSDIIFKNNSYYEPTSMIISNNSISEMNYEFFTIESLIKDSFEFDGALNIFGTDINISSKKDIITFTLKLLLFQFNYMINTLIYYSEHIKSISMNNYLDYLNWTRDSIVKLLDILLNARQYVQNKDYDYIIKSSSILNKKRSFKISFIIQSHIIVLKKMKILYDELCESLLNFQVVTLGQSQKLIYKVTELQLFIEKNLYSNKLFDKYISQKIVEDLFEITRLFDNIMKKYFILLSSLEVLDQLRSNSFLDKIGCQIYSLFRINQDFSRFTSEIPISIQECHALLYDPK
ncbi:uncharacterized protein CMU_014460 [Cryptosporidium muris RN66]|uniref:Uncharacterized protein n=1 Tax=Cryptosporidium muris (strain RN66) TaxID=441375 RepID=B6AF03_CRYMR|nr:uncharacterized protein CMU_014460 [Cryptosporidium muris RN66]EEA06770.1 hypothetical protein CMU_014460 [Cryptosporidium muris RN66]|eukprot:XP_002141119.1 hypothetical protein [Cryptosporidium muris RN66]